MSTYVVQPIVVGDTIDFVINARKDGAVYDLTDATVSLYLQKPDGTVLSAFSATVSDGPGGVAHYQTATTVLDTAGDWVRQWKTVKSGVVLWTRKRLFTVESALA